MPYILLFSIKLVKLKKGLLRVKLGVHLFVDGGSMLQNVALSINKDVLYFGL